MDRLGEQFVRTMSIDRMRAMVRPAVAEHLAFGRMLTPPEARNKQFARDRTTTRRLKVGYLSPDFRRHPLVSFVRPILEHHDRDQFEVLCYANVAAPDATTESLRGLADEWRSVFGLSDHELLTQIEADQVDLLVDLAGHTADSRIRVFAHRAAPVQISMLGYLNTTGLPEMDYVVTDAIRDPQAEDNYYSESVARLPSGGCCWLPPAGAPDVTAAPVFARGHVTFGSTHRPNKMTDETLRLWAAVLNRVAGSRLLLFHNDLADSVDLQQRLTDRLTAAGIDRSRFDLAWDADEEYLTAYGEIDILLEAVPWSSGTTALDALWMGVPIPTVCGQQPAGRPTASALQRLELGDLVARSTDEYIDIVAKLAADRARIAALRESLRDRMRTTVCDAVTHVRELETAYRDMWTRWCDAA